MASPAQITANRRNAQRSTGPKSVAGRRATARNATKHGLNAGISAEELAPVVAAIEAEIVAMGADPHSDTRLARAAALAVAQIRLARMRREESRILSEGDAHLRLETERKLVGDVLLEDILGQRELTEHERNQGYGLLSRLSHSGRISAQKTYQRLRRNLREAEAAHDRALRAFLQ